MLNSVRGCPLGSHFCRSLPRTVLENGSLDPISAAEIGSRDSKDLRILRAVPQGRSGWLGRCPAEQQRVAQERAPDPRAHPGGRDVGAAVPQLAPAPAQRAHLMLRTKGQCKLCSACRCTAECEIGSLSRIAAGARPGACAAG